MASEITKSDNRSLALTWIGRPSSWAGPSRVAANVSARTGSWTTPTLGTPSTTRPMATQNRGIPLA